MGLEGQHGERGYAMAALLVSLAVMSVLMGALLPAWRHQAQREKEAELVFRGEQYVRAIRLWEMKMGPGSRPPNFDILVQQKFLRKKYKDPMTEDGEFQPLYVGANLPVPGGPGGRGLAPVRADEARDGPGGIGSGGPDWFERHWFERTGGRSVMPPQPQPQQPSGVGGQMGGGILGVASKSKETSILIYQGKSHYNEWTFVFANASSAPGGPGSPMPGGRGGNPFPGGRGMPGGRGPGGRGLQPGGRGIGGGPGPGVNPGLVPPGGPRPLTPTNCAGTTF